MGTTIERLNAMLDATKRFDEKPSAVMGRKVGHPEAVLHFVPRITCADGFAMSVQASYMHYCSPRNSAGPWSTVEVGYPNMKVDAFMPYIDGDDSTDPTETVYGYVPLAVVADAIDAHGGFA